MQINYEYCGNPSLPSDSNFLARYTTRYTRRAPVPIRIEPLESICRAFDTLSTADIFTTPSLGRDSVLGIKVQTGRERKRRGEGRKSNRLLIDPPRIPEYGFEYTLDVRRASVL